MRGFLTFPCIFIFYGFFRGLEWSHDVPDPPAIVFGPGITQNGGTRADFDNFLSFFDFEFQTGAAIKGNSLLGAAIILG